MAKNKLLRYRQVTESAHVTEPELMEKERVLDEDFWRGVFPLRSPDASPLPLTLELACGKGEYTIGLAQRHPERRFVGFDIKGARLWVGARRVEELGLGNVHFVRSWIDHLAELLPPASVQDIWITFPDPYLRTGKAMKRLTSPRFLSIYRTVLASGGRIHLKTDSPELFAFTHEQIQEGHVSCSVSIEDIYADGVKDRWTAPEPASDQEVSPHEVPSELWTIRTYYEGRHLAQGRTIRYVQLHF